MEYLWKQCLPAVGQAVKEQKKEQTLNHSVAKPLVLIAGASLGRVGSARQNTVAADVGVA